MSRRATRLVAATVAMLGLSPAFAPAASAGSPVPSCKEGYFCLFEGPHQTGRVLLAEDAHIATDGFNLRELDDIEPPIFPRSARNPLPNDFGCIVRLNDRPHFAGDEQEVDGFGNHELDGRRVGSLTPDCG
ncbi:hypothetical protein GCM10012275_60260 [Longimycelium tulufanense]|uniref:Peptidase inhibitor family I36 n=1 Tax=Longimycelium tulufanense TaxID=907463 RepID=A0A8J3FZ51_9PSEU|nr:hypothetical protein [Longimycelium tulufanense]GGM81546.1 hypothetical protein GCM10012275_60260 [Longimycelium tulufanense]